MEQPCMFYDPSDFIFPWDRESSASSILPNKQMSEVFRLESSSTTFKFELPITIIHACSLSRSPQARPCVANCTLIDIHEPKLCACSFLRLQVTKRPVLIAETFPIAHPHDDVPIPAPPKMSIKSLLASELLFKQFCGSGTCTINENAKGGKFAHESGSEKSILRW